MYRNILVAVDHSEIADRVLTDAAGLAQALNAKLTVLSVAVPTSAAVAAAGVDIRGLEEAVAEEATKQVAAARERLPADLSVTTLVREGLPGPQIVQQIADGGHDLVVLGSRGRGRIASGVLGSVVGDVHFAARIPMLVIHPGA
jgi:nucleotide-binding universal stress UspA family protein